MGRTTVAKKDISQDEYLKSTPENDVETVVAQEVEQPLNLEQQVTVKSIAGWTTGFARILTIGDVTIPSKGSVRLSRNEIISQVHNGNNLFCGIDGKGSHATLIINDKATINEVDFNSDTQFSDNLVKKLFELNNQSDFENAVQSKIITRAEKYALMISIVKQGFNDYSKIRFCENYTGYNIDKVRQDESNIH